MPKPDKPDKHAAASQAVDILEEIAAMLVRPSILISFPKSHTDLVFALELPHGSSHAVDVHLID